MKTRRTAGAFTKTGSKDRSFIMLTSVAFDTLDYFDKLMAAGVPDAQARVQAEFLRDQVEQQTGEIRRAIEKYDESRRAELATKGDVQDVRLEIEKVRSETEKVRAETEKIRLEIRETEARLTTNIEQTRADLNVEIQKVRAETEKIRLEVKETEARLTTNIEQTRADLNVEIQKVRAETEKIRLEVKETEARLTTNIEQVRAETEKIRLEIKETEARLRTDMEKVKYALLKWQIGGWLALAAIMAKGFGWIGF